jgi:hypothetical protein
MFRSQADAALTAKIHRRVPVLIDEARGADGNPWRLSFMAMFHMSNDSYLFRTAPQLLEAGFVRDGRDWIQQPGRGNGRTASSRNVDRYVPLYEAKMVHQFDNRWATYEFGSSRVAVAAEKIDPTFQPEPRYWAPDTDTEARLSSKGWTNEWLMGWRDICRSTDERTLIVATIPRSATAGEFSLLLCDHHLHLAVALYANLNSLVCDYVARQKIGGSHLKQFMLKQLPVLLPAVYSPADLAFIASRVVGLIYTNQAMAAFANALGYFGPVVPWEDDRRAQLRAQLDAWYARAYGLTRNELRFILDPTDVNGPGYPSETFRVLKANEIRRFGEYRTARVTLEAWDHMEQGRTLDIAPAVGVRKHTSLSLQLATVSDLTALPDHAWANGVDNADATLAQLAALIKALQGPTPIARVRLAALYALEPRYLSRRLAGEDQITWRRLVGSAATPSTGANIAAFAPRINANWRDAITQLRGMGAMVEDTQSQTWAPGAAIREFLTSGWPDGRAAFVFKALEGIALDEATFSLAPEDQGWVHGYAA